MVTNQLYMSKFWVTLTTTKWVKATVKNLMLTYNTPEFSPKEIIVLYLKFKLLLVLSIIPGLLFFIFNL